MALTATRMALFPPLPPLRVPAAALPVPSAPLFSTTSARSIIAFASGSAMAGAFFAIAVASRAGVGVPGAARGAFFTCRCVPSGIAWRKKRQGWRSKRQGWPGRRRGSGNARFGCPAPGLGWRFRCRRRRHAGRRRGVAGCGGVWRACGRAPTSHSSRRRSAARPAPGVWPLDATRWPCRFRACPFVRKAGPARDGCCGWPFDPTCMERPAWRPIPELQSSGT